MEAFKEITLIFIITVLIAYIAANLALIFASGFKNWVTSIKVLYQIKFSNPVGVLYEENKTFDGKVVQDNAIFTIKDDDIYVIKNCYSSMFGPSKNIGIIDANDYSVKRDFSLYSDFPFFFDIRKFLCKNDNKVKFYEGSNIKEVFKKEYRSSRLRKLKVK